MSSCYHQIQSKELNPAIEKMMIEIERIPKELGMAIVKSCLSPGYLWYHLVIIYVVIVFIAGAVEFLKVLIPV